MSKWIDTTLGEFVGLQRGHDLPHTERVPGKVPVVGSGGVTGWHNTPKVPGPGVTIGRAANLGIPALIERDYWPLNTTLFVKDFRGNNVRFTYHLFQILDLAGFNSGTVQPMLNRNYISLVPIRVPDRPGQDAIAAVLGALDDKIAVNERIVATADTLSAALFNRATSECTTGFTDRPLSATAEFINGRAFTKNATGSGRMVVRIAEINSGPGASTVYNEIEVPEKHLAKPGDVLFAWSGSLTVARWFRPEAIINQHIFKCVPKNGYPQWLISQLVHRKIDEFRAIAADKATTMGHIQRKHLDEVVAVPDHELLQLLNAEIGPLWDRALLAEQENLTLAALRDTLLPQLMSGQLRVKDAEKIVEDAT